LCIPAAYLLRQNGPWVLVLLAVPSRVPGLARRRRQRAARRARSAA
jgi:hypothetical protein